METTSTPSMGEGDYENAWLYQGAAFTSEHIDDFFGFVYCITNKQNGRQYIGVSISGSLELREVKREK